MIQRIQTVYLAGVVILCALMFVFPFGEIQASEGHFVLDVLGVQYHEDGSVTEWPIPLLYLIFITILAIVVLIVALISVFMFRNRSIQIKLCKLNILLLTGLLFAVLYSPDMGLSMIAAYTTETEVNYKAGIAFPMVSIILTFLASRAIKKDEELVRAADRVR